MPPNLPARPAGSTPSHATTGELSKSPSTRKRPKLSSPASSDSRAPPPNAAVPITRSPVVEVNPAVPAETPQSPPSVPLSLPERTLAPNGEATRVEVAYSKFYSEVLASPEHRDAIEAMARMIIKTHAWDKAYARYHVEARDMWPSNGRRKNRMAELLNTIQAEAHRCGLPAPVRHEISFARHDEKGFDEHDPRVATDERGMLLEARIRSFIFF
ncbi:hypothetical protein DL93DRAFT_2080808 [Clavulina sp. PMI_390]|nr:hypothetical protein DL93DRAFT_2080808 [Clavulina sp. PMI_390]